MMPGGILPAALLVAAFLGIADTRDASAAPGGSPPSSKGEEQQGQRLFNGKGACAYCHGQDGYRDRMPQLESDTAALIARLNPPPADLRRPNTLRLKSDKARAKIIREGHEGTGMFPDTSLTDQEIAAIVAYLAVLRREGPTPR